MSYNNYQQQGPPGNQACDCGIIEAGPFTSGPTAKNPNETYYSCANDKRERGSGCKHFRFLRAELNSKRGGFGGGRGGGRGGGYRGGGGYGGNGHSAPQPAPSQSNYGTSFATPQPPPMQPSFNKRPREDEEEAKSNSSLAVLEGHIIDLLNNTLELQKAIARMETTQHHIETNMAEISSVMVTLVRQGKNVESMDQ